MKQGIIKSRKLDWYQVAELVKISMRMDLRDQRNRPDNKKRVSPLLRSLIFYVILSITLSTNLVLHAHLFTYVFFVLTYSMVMTAFSVLLDFSQMILQPQDVNVLSHRPLSSRTYFTAKLANLLFYMLLVGSALCLIPSLIGIGLTEKAFVFPFIFFPVSLVANLMTASVIILIYTTVMKILPKERFKDILVYIHIGLAVCIFLAYQLIPRFGSSMILETYFSWKWLCLIPSAWFAGAVQVLSGMGTTFDLQLLGIGAVVTFILLPLSFRRLSFQYTEIVKSPDYETISSKRKIEKQSRMLKTSGLLRGLLRYPEALAGYELARRMLWRDRTVKMGVFFGFVFSLVFLLLFIFSGDLRDPFQTTLFSDEGRGSIVFILIIFYMVHWFITSMLYTLDWEGEWVYHVAPLSSPGRIFTGIKWMVVIHLLLPYFILLGVIYGTQIDPVNAFKHTLTLFLFGLYIFSGTFFFIKDFPFSKRTIRGERSKSFLSFFCMLPMAALMGAIQKWVYPSRFGWWFTIAGLLAGWFILDVICKKKLNYELQIRG
jgi:hypothetical protein